MWNQDEEGLKRVTVIRVTSSEAARAGTYQPRRLHNAPKPPLVHFKTLTFESPRAQLSSGTLLSCTSTAGALPENNLETHVLFSERCVESGRKLIATFFWLVAYRVHEIGIFPVHEFVAAAG